MSHDTDVTDDLRRAVLEAYQQDRPLQLIGGNSKAFYGRQPSGDVLNVGAHRGIVDYDPTELVVTARAGTPLRELESLLDENGQILAFEPPHFGAGATLGGAIASGLSGPRRPYRGAVRDFVLGCRIVSGRGEALRFGGQVMKNVAGYDVSRLMCGALGTLGLLLEVSLKVLPKPAAELTVSQEMASGEAITAMNTWSATPLPITAACHDGARLHVRLEGAATAIRAARARIGGEIRDDGAAFWLRVREQRHGFFDGSAPLWRLALPPKTPELALRGKWLLDWGGAQRWLRSDAPIQAVRDAASRAGGHASLFRGGDRSGAIFHPLTPARLALHQRLKAGFDPKGILNPGRLYADL